MLQHKISQRIWGNAGQTDVYLFKIENPSGAYIELCNYGATLVSVYTPDKNGNLENVILGFSSLQGYMDDGCYIGATIGPFANRIANASFNLDGKSYALETNDGANCNHSGSTGFHQRVFDFEIRDEGVFFYLRSYDGTGGFPGNMDIGVAYTWSNDNELKITYTGKADRKTILNLTNHAYFNLSAGQQNIFGHELTINTEAFVAAGTDYIPNGKIEQLSTNDIFYKTMIGDRLLTADHESPKGINTCYVLKEESRGEDAFVAELKDPRSGRIMQLYTSYPGLMLYTGDYLNSKGAWHIGKAYQSFDGLCLEAQYFPDSPNQAGFPSTVLDPGAAYDHFITLKFNTQI